MTNKCDSSDIKMWWIKILWRKELLSIKGVCPETTTFFYFLKYFLKIKLPTFQRTQTAVSPPFIFTSAKENPGLREFNWTSAFQRRLASYPRGIFSSKARCLWVIIPADQWFICSQQAVFNQLGQAKSSVCNVMEVSNTWGCFRSETIMSPFVDELGG